MYLSLNWSKPELFGLLLQSLEDPLDGSGLVVNFDKMFSKRLISLIMFRAKWAVFSLSVFVLGVTWLVVLVLAAASVLNLAVSLPSGELRCLISLFLLLYRLIKIQLLLF